MALRLSTGFANYIASGGGWGDALKNGIIKVYSGSQPTTANDAATGTLLCQFSTGADGAFTAEVPCVAKIDFTSATTSCTALTIGTISLLSGTSLTGADTVLAAAVAADINATNTTPDFYAVVGGEVIGGITFGSDASIVYLIAPKNAGTSINGATVACTVGGGSVAINGGSSTTLGGAGSHLVGANAVTCLSMTYPPVVGTISKSGTWQDTLANATGTAGWFRFLCTPYFDDGSTTLITTGHNAKKLMRLDGTVGTSGSDMIISSTSITVGAAQTVSQFDLTVA